MCLDLFLILISLEKQNKRNEELIGADVVVLTYACNDSQSFSRLSSYWFRELQKLEVGVFFLCILLVFD
jgi:Ras family protein T1